MRKLRSALRSRPRGKHRIIRTPWSPAWQLESVPRQNPLKGRGRAFFASGNGPGDRGSLQSHGFLELPDLGGRHCPRFEQRPTHTRVQERIGQAGGFVPVTDAIVWRRRQHTRQGVGKTGLVGMQAASGQRAAQSRRGRALRVRVAGRLGEARSSTL